MRPIIIKTHERPIAQVKYVPELNLFAHVSLRTNLET